MMHTYTVTVTDGRGRYSFLFTRLARALRFARAARRCNRAAVLAVLPLSTGRRKKSA